MNIDFIFSIRTLLFISLIAIVISCKKEDSCLPATVANAGTDQNIIGTSVSLAANAPASGVGAWSIVSGVNGVIVDPLNPTSLFSGTVTTTYVLKWSVTGCPSSEDEVQIMFSCDPAAAANAGPDQVVVGTSATLAANTSASGAGIWSIVSGTGGTITTVTSPASAFTGVVGTTYVLRWTVSCPASQDDVQISFNDGNPNLLTVDKTSVINGEIITITGVNFASNFNGGSQVNALKLADPVAGQEVFIPVISRTATEIKAAMVSVYNGAYSLRYNKKPDAGAAVLFNSNLTVNVVNPTANQFFTSSTFTATNISKGSEASFGIKNGSLVPSDYTIKLLNYNYVTGSLTEYDAPVTSITAAGFDTMDKLSFTVPASVPAALYKVKVTYSGKSLLGGWFFGLNVN
jgi:hypothetical protein